MKYLIDKRIVTVEWGVFCRRCGYKIREGETCIAILTRDKYMRGCDYPSHYHFYHKECAVQEFTEFLNYVEEEVFN